MSSIQKPGHADYRQNLFQRHGILGPVGTKRFKPTFLWDFREWTQSGCSREGERIGGARGERRRRGEGRKRRGKEREGGSKQEVGGGGGGRAMKTVLNPLVPTFRGQHIVGSR